MGNCCALAIKAGIGRCSQWWEEEFRPKWKVGDLLIVLGIAALGTLIICFRLGEGSIGDYDEAAYAQIAREILRTNDWNTLRWNGVEFFDKPPVCMWLTAIAYKIFGVNEFAARFLAALSGIGAVILTCLLGKELFSSWAVGLGAALILLTPSQNLHSHGYNFVSLARVGMLDMPLIFLILSSLSLAWLSQRKPRCLIWLGIPLGLGVMVKSIAGFLAYFIVFTFFVFAVSRRVWWRRELGLGLLISALIITPWHLSQLLIWGRRFFDSYMVQLTIGYVTGEEGHLRDPFFYLRSLMHGFSFWSIVVAIAFVYTAYCSIRFRDPARVLMLCWVAIPFFFFNISRSKIGWYIIPIYPALAILTAQAIVAILGKRAGFLLILALWLFLAPKLPAVGDFNPDVKDVVLYSNYVMGPQDKLVNYWPGSYWIRPAVAFYSNRYLTFVNDKGKLLQLLSTGDESYYILADEVYWGEIAEIGHVVYQKGHYLLAKSGF